MERRGSTPDPPAGDFDGYDTALTLDGLFLMIATRGATHPRQSRGAPTDLMRKGVWRGALRDAPG